MKVIAISGSPRSGGNTYTILSAMADVLKEEGADTEIVQLGTKAIHGCIHCGHCYTSENHLCVFGDDLVNQTALKMREADGFILGSPTYYAGIAGSMKCFCDRVFYTSSRYFAYKAATAVAVVRRTGGLDTLHQLRNYLQLSQTITPPSQYWTVVYGADKGEVLQDMEGMQTARRNAKALAWVMKNRNEAVLSPPPEKKRERTNFIR